MRKIFWISVIESGIIELFSEMFSFYLYGFSLRQWKRKCWVVISSELQNWLSGLGVLEYKWLWVSFVYPILRRVMIISLSRSRCERFFQEKIDFLLIRSLILVFVFHKFCHVVRWVWMSVFFMSSGFRTWRGGSIF